MESDRKLRTVASIFTFWLYAFERIGLEWEEEAVLWARAARHALFETFARLGVAVPRALTPPATCRWLVETLAAQGLTRRGFFRLEEAAGERMAVAVEPDCPHGFSPFLGCGTGSAVCKQALLFCAALEEVAGRQYAYRLEELNPGEGCRFLLVPAEAAAPGPSRQGRLLERLQAAVGRQGEARHPGLWELVGRDLAGQLSGDLAACLAEFARLGLGELRLHAADPGEGHAVFGGRHLRAVHGARGRFVEGFLAGTVERLCGVPAACEEVRCGKGPAPEECSFCVRPLRREDFAALGRLAAVRVAVGYWCCAAQMVLPLAVERGLDAARGLAVEPVFFQRLRDFLDSVRARRLQAAFLPLTYVFLTAQQGRPWLIVGALTRGGAGLVLRPEVAAAWPEPAGPDPLVLAVPHVRSVEELLLARGAGRWRLHYRTVTVEAPQLAAALRRCEIDGFVAHESWLTHAELTGAGRVVEDFSAVWPDHVLVVLAVDEEWAFRRPDAVASLARLVGDAAGLWHREPDAVVAGAAQRMGVPERVVRRALASGRISLRPTEVSPAELAPYLEAMVAAGWLKALHPPERYLWKPSSGGAGLVS
ncbi:MAG: ABC transporter substrate-binding protein [Desulfotomaculales bacterium]